jgi:hypothetical protein
LEQGAISRLPDTNTTAFGVPVRKGMFRASPLVVKAPRQEASPRLFTTRSHVHVGGPQETQGCVDSGTSDGLGERTQELMAVRRYLTTMEKLRPRGRRINCARRLETAQKGLIDEKDPSSR